MTIKKLVYGVGINDTTEPTEKSHRENNKKVTEWVCPYYRKWTDMLRRCYSKTKPLGYENCYVCEEWLYFSNFRAWAAEQGLCEDNRDLHLDKDLKVIGNKEYSPDKCTLVPYKLNSFIVEKDRGRGKYLIGVSLDKASNKYRATCRLNGKAKYLGLYNSEEEAHQAWKSYKLKLVKDMNLRGDIPCKEIYESLLIKYS